MKKILDFGLVKMGKFGFFSTYSTHLKLLISKLVFHSHNRIFRIRKSLKATYILLVTKTKITFLNAKNSEKQTNILVSSGNEKTMVVSIEVQNGYCVKYSILGDND